MGNRKNSLYFCNAASLSRGLIGLAFALVYSSSAPAWASPPHRPDAKPPESVAAAPKPKPPSPNTVAYLRLWKSASAAGHPLRVTLTALQAGKPKPGGPPTPEFGAVGAGCSFGNYVEVPAGQWVCAGADATIAKPEEADLARLTMDLRPGSYGTVLFREGPDKHWHGEYIDDNRSDTAPDSAQLTIRNLTPGLADVSVKVAEVLDAHFKAPDSFLQMSGLARGSAQIITHGTLPDGQAFEWNTEANFASFSKATLLIFPDPYGRVRPRLFVDGPGPVSTDSPPAEPAQKNDP